MPQSLGALGGKPNNAYYFIGFLGKERGISSKCSGSGVGLAEGFHGRPSNFYKGSLLGPEMLFLVSLFCL